jgi:DNA-binding response OmpR family regulator
MNGTISVKSKLHQGTEFIIEIPITNESEISHEVATAISFIEDSEYQKIDKITSEQENVPLLLIVEDNADVAQFIASCLHNQYKIIFAQDGVEGVQKALEIIPDLIITDLMMPKADGFEVCQKLKNDEKTSHIPIIMLTARTMEKDKIKGLAFGADAYLTKPFNQNELRIRIEQLILNRKRLQEKYQKTGFLITESSSKETEFINKCIQHIHKHLDDEHFKSVQLAFAVSLSESQLYRKIKAITNLSTAVFIREVRLTVAKDLLLKTDLNISEIAYQCGFSNPDWFSKSFKEKFGYSPSDFRKHN